MNSRLARRKMPHSSPHVIRDAPFEAYNNERRVTSMRGLVGLLCVSVSIAMPVVGCSEAEEHGGSGGSAGSAGGGGNGGGGGSVEMAVGDPCIPAQVPEGGFVASVTYLETSSEQCATRVCLVRELAGDPNNLQEHDCPLGDATCVSASEVERSIYCSCRCDAEDAVPTCDCPSGFMCEDISQMGAGRRLGYCVRDDMGT